MLRAFITEAVGNQEEDTGTDSSVKGPIREHCGNGAGEEPLRLFLMVLGRMDEGLIWDKEEGIGSETESIESAYLLTHHLTSRIQCL